MEDAEAGKSIDIRVGRDKMTGGILKEASKDTVKDYGFVVSGLAIKHFNYVKPIIPKIYERMRSERIRIANRYESEGREREAKILGKMTKDLEKISSEGYSEATRIRGEADAKVLKIYADAYGQDADFYSYSRSLDLYPHTFSAKTRLVLATDDHDFLQYIKGYKRTAPPARAIKRAPKLVPAAQ